MKYSIAIPFLLFVFIAKAQTGELSGKILNHKGEGVSKVKVDVFENSASKSYSAISDKDGNYTVRPVPSGVYNILFSCKACETKTDSGVIVKADRSTWLNVTLDLLAKKRN